MKGAESVCFVWSGVFVVVWKPYHSFDFKVLVSYEFDDISYHNVLVYVVLLGESVEPAYFDHFGFVAYECHVWRIGRLL